MDYFFLVCTDLNDSLLYLEKSFLAIVAIDFGTTYSGFAFSFNKEQGEDSIFMNRDWVNGQGHRTSKTPTCLLLNSDLSFDSFGYKAVEKYANLRSVYEEKDFLFFQHFKMALHNEEVSPFLCHAMLRSRERGILSTEWVALRDRGRARRPELD